MTSVDRRLARIATDLNEEQVLIARAIRGYATSRLAPRAAARDRDGAYSTAAMATRASSRSSACTATPA
jgi:hypothetical protein